MPPVLRRQIYENFSLEASLSYRVRPYLRKTSKQKQGMGAHFYDPTSTWKVEAETSRVQDHAGL